MKGRGALLRARIIRQCTEDGLMEFYEDTPVGTEYFVIRESLRYVRLYNVEYHRDHWKWTIAEAVTGLLLPAECLEMM